MSLGLDGKTALITAASEGLGYACAARLAAEKCAIAICGRHEQTLTEARANLLKAGAREAVAIKADIAEREGIERLMAQTLAQFGRLDILIVNGGHIAYGGLEDLTDQQWQEAFDLLLMSAVRLTRLVLPIMRANKGGDIVVLGSATAREPPPHLLLSNVMRLGVAGLVRTLARATAPDNIRVNLVAPGYFDAGRVKKRIRALMQDEKLSFEDASRRVSGDLPIGRIGLPEEFAELVAFVASRKAGFMTGTTIAIDGGGNRSIL